LGSAWGFAGCVVELRGRRLRADCGLRSADCGVRSAGFAVRSPATVRVEMGSRRVDAGASALAEYSDPFEYRARVERAKISDVRRKDEGALALCNEHD